MVLLISNPVWADVENEEHEVLLLSSVKKISITNYISIFGFNEKPSLSFHLMNVGKETAEEIQLIPTSLTMKEESRFSTSPFHILEEKVKIEPDDEVDLNAGETMSVKFVLDRIFDNEGSYEGQLRIIGHNFDPITIDVEIIIKENPWELVLFTLLGTALSSGIGYFYTKREKMKEYRQLIDDDADIISQINGHIRTLNLIRMTVDTHTWKNICKIFEEKKRSIEKYRDQLNLSRDAEAVKWFEDIAKLAKSKYFVLPEDRNNPEKPEIEKPNHDDQKYLKKREEMIREKWKSDATTKTKYFFFIGTLLISLPTTIFASDSFVGHPVMNILIASSLGFTIYRAQDIPKAIAKSVKKSTKIERVESREHDEENHQGHHTTLDHNH